MQPTKNHPGGIHCGSLEAGTNDTPDRTEGDGSNTSKLVAEPATNQAADEGTDIIDRDNTTLKKFVVDDRATVFAPVSKLHGLVIVIRGGVYTSHHTLIITEEEDGQSGDAIDSGEKAALLQLVDDIGGWNDVHD